MEFAQIVNDNADAFSSMENASEVFSGIQEVLSGLGIDIMIHNPQQPEYIGITDYNNAQATIDSQTKLLAGLEDLKKAAAGNDALTTQIETISNQLQASKDEAQLLRVDSELLKHLKSAKNPETALKLINREGITIATDGKTVHGAEDAVKKLQETDAYLFDLEEKPGGTGGGAGNHQRSKDDKKGGVGSRIGKSKTPTNSDKIKTAESHYFG